MKPTKDTTCRECDNRFRVRGKDNPWECIIKVRRESPEYYLKTPRCCAIRLEDKCTLFKENRE